MSARFAGSNRTDERRRRRLATEGEPGAGVPEFAREMTTRVRLDSVQAPPARRQVLLPLRLVISERVWLHVLFAVAVLAGGLGLLAVAFHLDQLTPIVGPGLTRVLGPHGTLIQGYQAGVLVLAMQLSALIRWVRSRSHADYSGRYWIWRPVTWACGAFALTLVTGLHHAVADTLAWALHHDVWRQDVVLWLLPAAFGVAVIGWPLRNELRSSQSSSTFLTVALLAWWLASLIALDLVEFPSSVWGWASADGLLLLGNVSLMLGMSLHARHVLHHSADPPAIPPRTPLPRPHFRWLLGRTKPDTADKPSGTAKSKAVPAEESSKKRRKPAKKRKPARKGSTAAAAVEEVADDAVTDESPDQNVDEHAELPTEETDDYESGSNSSHGSHYESVAAEEPEEAEEADWNEPVARPERPAPAPAARNSALGRGLSTGPAPSRAPEPYQQPPAAQGSGDVDDDDDGDADDGQSSGSNAQGLTRKQRKKLEKQRRQQGR